MSLRHRIDTLLELCPSWLPVVAIAIAGSFWIGQTRGWHPWGFATQANVFPFVDLTGRISNLNQLFQTGNIYQVFDYLAFTYPPSAIAFFAPLHFVSLAVVYWLWSLTSLLALALICYQVSLLALMGHRRRVLRWSTILMVLGLLFLPPIYECLDLGQTGLIVAALVTYDYLHQGRTQGLLTGVAVALKLLPIVFVLWWLFNREWRAARNGLLTFAGLSLLAFALWRKSFRYFVRVVIGHGAEFHQLLTGPKLRANSSVVAMLVVGPQRTFFMTHKWLLAVIVTVAIVFLFVAVRSLLARDMPVSALLTLVIGSNVASLVTWDHYLVIVGLIPLLWISEIPIHRGTGKLIAAALALYLVPWWRIRYGRLNHSWSHTLHVTASLGLLAATAIFLAGVLGEARRRHEAQASALMKRTLVA